MWQRGFQKNGIWDAMQKLVYKVMPINSKEDIKREHLTNSMLKKVLMRADFTSMLDLERVVSNMNQQEWFRGRFLNYEKRLLETVLDENNIDENSVANALVKRFDHCTIPPESNVVLDMSSQFVTMLINCDENYTKIDDYLSLFVQILAYIISNDDYVKFTRFAIRKTDGMEFENGGQADEVFEYFDQNVANPEKDAFYYRTYTDSFVCNEEKINVHYNRTVRVVNNCRFIFVLDIDTFIGSEMIESPRPSEDELNALFKKLNVLSFELYKRGVKFEYLKSSIKRDDNEA